MSIEITKNYWRSIRKILAGSRWALALGGAIVASLLSLSPLAQEDRIQLDTTVIKGNTELPKILYVVPWQDISEERGGEQKLTLHSLFGDLYDPVTPPAPAIDNRPEG